MSSYDVVVMWVQAAIYVPVCVCVRVCVCVCVCACAQVNPHILSGRPVPKRKATFADRCVTVIVAAPSTTDSPTHCPIWPFVARGHSLTHARGSIGRHVFKPVSSKVALDAAAATKAAAASGAKTEAAKAEQEAKLEAMKQRYLARKNRGGQA